MVVPGFSVGKKIPAGPKLKSDKKKKAFLLWLEIIQHPTSSANIGRTSICPPTQKRKAKREEG